jgi:hypothetical protein
MQRMRFAGYLQQCASFRHLPYTNSEAQNLYTPNEPNNTYEVRSRNRCRDVQINTKAVLGLMYVTPIGNSIVVVTDVRVSLPQFQNPATIGLY